MSLDVSFETYLQRCSDVQRDVVATSPQRFVAGWELYLILQRLYYTSKILGDTEKIVSLKSKGFSAEKLTTPTTTYNSLSPSIKWHGNSIFVWYLKEAA